MDRLIFSLLMVISFTVNATYRIVNLGDLGGNDSGALALNASGDVVGDSLNKSGTLEAFLYQNASGINGLGTLGGNESSAWSINDMRQVVGTSVNITGNDEAFLFLGGSGMIGLGTMGGRHSSASALNNKGQVVGFSMNALGNIEAFIFVQGEGMKGLGSLGGNDSFAWDINSNGQVVGNSINNAGNFEAFMYDEKNGMKGLKTLGGDDSYAWAINSNALIVGESQNNSGNFVAFLYKADTGMVGLGTTGGSESAAFAINAEGQIVGLSRNRLGNFEAVIYENGRMIPLLDLVTGNSSGWTSLTMANDINDAGQIVGIGEFKGVPRAFLLNPVNEPIPVLVTTDLDIHLHSTIFESAGGNQSIWVNLDFDGIDEFGGFFWKLNAFGEEQPQSDTFATVSPDLNIQIKSAVFKSETGDLDIWANLIFVGSDATGEFLWKLVDFGVNP